MITYESFEYEEVIGLKFGYSLIGVPKLFSHLYFIDGLLIDTGQSKTRKQILSAIDKLPIEQILVTHYHEDHSGNIPQLRERHQCKVFASEPCCEIMKNPPRISLAQQMTWGNRKPVYDLTPIGDRINTNQYSFEIIPIPGHAVDMIALYEPKKKWLFSADLFINTYIGYFLDNESILDQIDSIKKILKLDFDVLFCSHNPQFINGREKLEKKLAFLELSFIAVEERYRKGLSTSQIFKDLNLKENWFIKALSGGHLSKLNMVKAIVRDIDMICIRRVKKPKYL